MLTEGFLKQNWENNIVNSVTKRFDKLLLDIFLIFQKQTDRKLVEKTLIQKMHKLLQFTAPTSNKINIALQLGKNDEITVKIRCIFKGNPILNVKDQIFSGNGRKKSLNVADK